MDDLSENIIDPADAAQSAGLRYVTDEKPGITRRKSGRGWSFRDPHGRTIRNPEVIARIKKLAIPPAYKHPARL